MYYFVFVYTDLVKTVEEECKYLLFSIIFKCRFQHLRDLIQNLRDLNWREALGEYFFYVKLFIFGVLVRNETVRKRLVVGKEWGEGCNQSRFITRY